MSQIWLTYDELGSLLNCDLAHARAVAAAVPLDRRKSRDGQTRAKLSPSLTEMFLDNLLRDRLERRTESQVHDLRTMHARMAEGLQVNPSKGAIDLPALIAS